MNTTNYLYICNWKQYFTRKQALAWCTKHDDALLELSSKEKVILCPDLCTIEAIETMLPKIAIGAQNCSAYEHGAYTGEVPAESLRDVGASFCIIGHSERRRFFKETPEAIANKLEHLQNNNITAILCVSNNFQAELEPVLSKINPEKKLVIAYEPVSAIGTGVVPSNEEIEQKITEIKQALSEHMNISGFTFIYGGSVNGTTAETLKQIPSINGFLIGKASTDFQELKKIVSSTY